jgi:hypothetical protein
MQIKKNIKIVILSILIILSGKYYYDKWVGENVIYEDPKYVDFGEDETQSESDNPPMPENIINNYFEIDGIKLYYDPQLILDINPPMEVVDVSDGVLASSPIHPKFIHINLFMENAQVYILPIEDFINFNEDFLIDLIDVADFITAKPDSIDNCMAELSLVHVYHTCDHQQLSASLNFVNFQNGKGFRFVSVYGVNDLTPVDNEHLEYVYQGFTNDERFFIKVIAQVSHDLLLDSDTFPDDIANATDMSVYDDYFNEFQEILNTSDTDYAPNLLWVDSFIQSFWIE